MKRVIILMMITLFATVLFSQTTGVIRGVVLDDMGDPLPGANVVVVNSTWGAEADEDGYYYIIGVRAGTYTLRAQFIGFVPREAQEVRVRVGLTTTQNFRMTTEVMELAEIGVEVAMDRKVEMDVTTSQRTVDMGSIDNMAVTQVEDVLKQTSGIQTDADGELHFRGGRAGEVNYQLDGISVGDPTGAKTNPVEINFANVESFNIQKGIPDAEVGDALSGSVNIVMKIGDQEKTSGHVKYSTDTFFGNSKLNYDRGEFSLSGPVPIPMSGIKPTYYIATDFTLQDGYGRSYRDKGDPDADYFEFKDHDLTGFGFEVPQRRLNNFNLIFRGAYDFSLTQKFSVSYNKSRTNSYAYNYYNRYTPETSTQEITDVTIFNMNWRHTINQQSYYDLIFSYYNRDLERLPGGMKPDDFTRGEETDVFVVDYNDLSRNNDVIRNGVRDGGDAEGYIDTNQNGYFDRERYVDNSGSGYYNPEAGDVFYPFNPDYDHNMNGVWDGDILFDSNKNGKWDYWDIGKSFSGFGDDVYTAEIVEGYIDADMNGHYDPYVYSPRGTIPGSDEPFVDGDSFYDTGEPFIDQKKFYNSDYDGSIVELPNFRYDDDVLLNITLYSFIRLADNSEIILDEYRPADFESRVNAQIANPFYSLVTSEYEWYPPMSPPRHTHTDGISYVIMYRIMELEYQAEQFADLRSSGGSAEQPNPVFNGIIDRPNGLFDEFEAYCKPRPYGASTAYDDLGWVPGYHPDNNSGVVWYVGSYTEYKTTYDMYINTPPLAEIRQDAYSTWTDWNKNGKYDRPNGVYDPGEPIVDYNHNGVWDKNTGFLEPGYYLSGSNYSLFDNTVMKLKGSYTNQISRYHMIKTGFELTLNDLDYYSMSNPWETYDPDRYGYSDDDPYPTRGFSKTTYKYKPKEFSAFLQDKMEFEDLVVNAGIRYDMRALDDKAVDYYEERHNNGEIGYEDKLDRYIFAISPRFGISHSISESSKLFFSYGHLYQLPNYTLVFDPNTKSADHPLFGNMNLGYERNVQYELGVVNEIGDYLVDITGYFKDIYDMVNTRSYQDGIFEASTYYNADYGKTRGVEITVDRSLRDNYMWGVSYALSYAYGKSSSYVANYTEDEVEIREFPLDWDERHAMNSYFTVVYGRGENFYDIPYLDDWTFNISTDFGSGQPFTPHYYYYDGKVAQKDILRNSERLPWTSNTDLKFTKSYSFFGQNNESYGRLRFEFSVNNLFNKTNVLWVWDDSGNWHSRSSMWHEANPGASNMTDVWRNPTNIAEKRYFRMGLSYSW